MNLLRLLLLSFIILGSASLTLAQEPVWINPDAVPETVVPDIDGARIDPAPSVSPFETAPGDQPYPMETPAFSEETGDAAASDGSTDGMPLQDGPVFVEVTMLPGNADVPAITAPTDDVLSGAEVTDGGPVSEGTPEGSTDTGETADGEYPDPYQPEPDDSGSSPEPDGSVVITEPAENIEGPEGTESPTPTELAPVPPPVEDKRPWIFILIGLTAVIFITLFLFLFARKGKRRRGKYVRKSDRSLDNELTSHTIALMHNGAYQFGSCIGQGKRDYQEDALWFTESFNPGDPVCAVIADGMGGMENGRESSLLAASIVSSGIKSIRTDKDIPSKLWQICNAANDEVFKMNSERGLNGGSTLICAFINKNQLYWISVGDSRIFLYRNGLLSSVNEEHELEMQMYSELLDGEIRLIEIRNTPERELRKLTSNIGRDSIPLIDQNFIPYQLHKGDKLLLCSDGISGTLNESDLLYCLEDSDPEVNCDKLVQLVETRNKRGQDNYSAVVIHCLTEDGIG